MNAHINLLQSIYPFKKGKVVKDQLVVPGYPIPNTHTDTILITYSYICNILIIKLFGE